jgi:hypothetical protein
MNPELSCRREENVLVSSSLRRTTVNMAVGHEKGTLDGPVEAIRKG